MIKMRVEFISVILGSILVLMVGCMPQTQQPRPSGVTEETETTAGSSGGGTTNTEVLFDFASETRNFIEMGATRSYDVQTVSIDSTDSMLVWGKTVQERIQALPIDSKVCLLAEFKHVSPSNILVLSALRRRIVLNTRVTSSGVVSTVAYQWLTLPSDSARNQSDCLTTGIINAKNSLYGATASLKFSLQEVCSNCLSSPISEGFKALFDSGNQITDLNTAALKLKIQLSSGGNSSGQQCSSNSGCAQIGFNCCLEGQCVKDGAVKAGIDTSSSAFIQAWEDVQNNPTRFTNYPQFFYVCSTNVPTDPQDDDATDPNFSALKRFNQMRDLYECLNPQFDEIGFCPIRIENASTKISSTNISDKTFTVNTDDNNFHWANNLLNANTIYHIRYGEQILYQEGLQGFDSTNVSGSHSFPGSGNSNLDSAQSVIVTKTMTNTTLDDTLVIKYKVDATCEKLSTTLARCTKTYVQGRSSTTPRPADHLSSNYFALPVYSDLVSFIPTVKVGGTSIAQSDTTWRVSGKGILFTQPVTTNQTVTITYYVTPSTGDLDMLTAGRLSAQTAVNQFCGCGVVGATKCNLKPVEQTLNGVTTVTDYSCVYPPPPLPEPPLQQVIYVSAKTVPHRYHDINGAVWDNDTGANAPAQEGIEFKYTNGDPLKPNNLTSYVGFNEIYGTFNKQGGSAKPPRMVAVKKDRIYDIFVDSGGFASCDNCGNDPYAPILKLFPQSFATKGGGYFPDAYNSNRTSNTGLYRADDLIFGRACFVPATMIAWGHADYTSVDTQRRRRLAAQHFLFANGYQRDWYGFDYGSLIGSFDGVNWFSIGNQRRIKANGSRLLLAVNGFFGDMTTDNNFKVVVSESLSAANSGSYVTHDSMSDGAECQRFHYCSNDNDCISTLGYDYTCQNVTTMTAKKPLFDVSGNELAGEDLRSIISGVGGANGRSRRCVYRGRGAPCETDLTNLLGSYNGSDIVGLAACAPNHYCAKVDATARFNTSVARFASSPIAQNLLGTLGQKDTVGQGARTIGRPFDYYGTKTPATINSSEWGLSTTSPLRDHLKLEANVEAICLPGREIATSSTFADAQFKVPSQTDKEAADRILGVGATMKLNSTLTTSPKSVAMCPTTVSGTFSHHNPFLSLTDPTHQAASIAQNITSSLMDMSDYASLNLFNTTNGNAATRLGYQRNACMRSAGASCVSDFECAPSAFIATKMKSLPSFGSFVSNAAEQAFWKEELVCGNPEPARIYSNELNTNFSTTQNRCCREINKTITTLSQFDGNTSFVNCVGNDVAVAGHNLPINSQQRNPRNNIAYDKAWCGPTPQPGKTPALVVPSPRVAADVKMPIVNILRQYETLDTVNSRMCCTTHWVRSFASENGGGHTWGQGRMQSIDRTKLYSWSWWGDQQFYGSVLEAGESEKLACSADNFGTLACEIRSLTDNQIKVYLEWLDIFELVGIPQVLIPKPTAGGDTARIVDTAQVNIHSQGRPLEGTLIHPVIEDVSGTSGDHYVSAASYTKMEVQPGKLKKVFSESEFNCCIPAGGRVPKDATAGMCCTGTLTDETPDGEVGEARCCLDDFSDVTVYLNRYVSSEGRGLPESMYDSKTGYIRDPGQVFAIAQSKNLCCSGKMVTGNIIADLFIPLQGGNRLPQAKAKRFAYRTDALDNNEETQSIGDRVDMGFRFNNHIYCAPADYEPVTNGNQ